MSRAPEEVAYLRAVLAASAVAADALLAMELVAELLAPERSAALAAEIEQRHAAPLGRARDALAAAPPPEELAPFDEIFAAAFGHTMACIELFSGFPHAPPPERIPRILTALHHQAQAQEHFYTIRALLPPLRDYWTPDHAQSAEGTPPVVPLLRVGAGGHHGGFSIYVPEQYDAGRAWPLVVALHGGSGNGRDFLWTWVRSAKARGYLVVAPTASSRFSTGSPRVTPSRAIGSSSPDSPTAAPSRSSTGSRTATASGPLLRCVASSTR